MKRQKPQKDADVPTGKDQGARGERRQIKIVKTGGCMRGSCSLEHTLLLRDLGLTLSTLEVAYNRPKLQPQGTEAFSHFLWHQAHGGTHTYV